MSDTPETDHLENGLEKTAHLSHPILWATCRKLERERNEAIHGSCVNYNFTQDARRERDEAREQNAKLREIAERAIWRMVNGVCLPDVSAVRVINEEGLRLRAELEQIKEEAK